MIQRTAGLQWSTHTDTRQDPGGQQMSPYTWRSAGGRMLQAGRNRGKTAYVFFIGNYITQDGIWSWNWMRSRWREDKGRRKRHRKQSWNLHFRSLGLQWLNHWKLVPVLCNSLPNVSSRERGEDQRSTDSADTYSPRFPCWAWHWCGTAHPTETQKMFNIHFLRWLI